MTDSRKYVLVTPTKNEEALIGETILSVTKQTLRPIEWVIVDDGSTDKTSTIVRNASHEHPWIHLLTLPPRVDRHFGAVVYATEAGVRAVQNNDYAYIGLIDSDVRFDANYFATIIVRFEASPQLGLAGGVVIDVGTKRNELPRNRRDVPGAVQFYRRTCFESLNGLLAIPEGGWDGLSCAQARMKGYDTRLFVDLIVDHLKPRNIAEGGALRRKWQMGVRDHAVGYHPMFELAKCVGRVAHAPIVIGALAWWLGYCSAVLCRREVRIPVDLLNFLRNEQKSRLLKAVTSCFRPGRSSPS